ncbi:hypothetical protein FXO38_00753 [Capsicum annuum]|nr:hypothetical protein FXO37_33229 [Capsicum annuum]KAF3683519.1 hypothetical protein FXO38_00753 [Capsicum annuum]
MQCKGFQIVTWGSFMPKHASQGLGWLISYVLEKKSRGTPLNIGVREIFSRLTQGQGDSTTYHSYISQSNYKRYREEQEKQGATVVYVERSYSALAASYRKLKDSLEKMVNRQKKRGKFFRKLWKRVKYIFKVLKHNHPIPSLRLDSEDETPVEWSADDVGGGDTESPGEDSS